MSGGSYNYTYSRIREMADEILPTTTLRKAFKRHLYKVADACHDIEWVDSGDFSKGGEDDAIRKCLGESCDALILEELLVEARRVNKELEKMINKKKNQ